MPLILSRVSLNMILLHNTKVCHHNICLDRLVDEREDGILVDRVLIDQHRGPGLLGRNQGTYVRW